MLTYAGAVRMARGAAYPSRLHLQRREIAGTRSPVKQHKRLRRALYLPLVDGVSPATKRIRR
jgi:hypothetical protein